MLFLEKIFSVTNHSEKHYLIKIFGIKIKYPKKNIKDLPDFLRNWYEFSKPNDGLQLSGKCKDNYRSVFCFVDTIIDNVINPIISEATISIQPEKDINFFQFIMPYLAGVWLVGIAALLIYTLVSFLRLKRKIGTAVLLRDNIYQSESVVSPFVLGIIKPKIYLPFNMNGQDMEHVIAHEQAHIRRKDFLWKPLGFLILTLHWFNPMVWLGYILLCRDIELACDEKVIKVLDNEQRADYSQALVSCSVNRRMIAACPLAFGEVSVKDRVKSVMNYKRPAFWVVLVSVIACAVVAVCFLTNPVTKAPDLSFLNYENAISMYYSRRNHKLSEWHVFCDWILDLPYFKELFSLDENE